MDIGTSVMVLILLCTAGPVWKRYQKSRLEEEHRRLLKANPQAWKVMKDQEAAESERRRQAIGGAAMKGVGIAARMFLKR